MHPYIGVPSHKQTDPAKAAGQIINHDMMDDMTEAAAAVDYTIRKLESDTHRASVTAAAKLHKPAHGGYPGTVK